MSARDVCITGIGIVTSLGEGLDAHAAAMGKPVPNVEKQRFAPYPVHPLAEPDWTSQISRRDKRQMEPWQQIGTYAAGLALDDAGLKGNAEATDRMDMIVAAGGGERDIEVDTAILEEAPAADDREAFVAERLSNDLRPTLFLAQLSNLLAGNISIVHKVTGSSRTFMGEEGAGIAAVQIAAARVAAGQSDSMLVGGSFSAEREDMQLVFELGQYLATEHAPIAVRDGLILGSMGVFMHLEPRETAEARNAAIHAVLEPVQSAQSRSERRSQTLADLLSHADIVLSAATGVPSSTKAEADALGSVLPDIPVRHYGALFGHGVEAQFPLGVALAAICLSRGALPDPFDDGERPLTGAVQRALVTTMGHWRGEGTAIVRAG